MLLDLLNKNDQLKLDILLTLESQPNTMSIKNIVEKLQVSEYYITGAINSLITDVERIGLPEALFSIEILDNKIVQYTRHSSLSAFNYLLYIYSLESNFSLFFKNFLFESVSTQVEFLEENFISKTSFFRLRKEFEPILNRFNVSMTAKIQLLGSERDIRNFLYIYLLTSYGDVKAPFSPDLEIELDKLIDSVENLLPVTLFNSDRLKLRYYLYVIYVRTNLHHYISTNKPTNSDYNNIMERVSVLFINFFKLTNEFEAQSIVDDLFIFLFASGIIPSIKLHNDVLPALGAIRKKFQTDFHISNETMRQLFTPDVNIKMAQYLTHLIFFNYPINSLVDPQNISYLNENFLEYQSFSRSVITNLLPAYLPRHKHLLKHYAQALSTDLLLLIIANFDLNLVTSPVIVTIDFTYGDNYNKFVEHEIMNFKSLNLMVTHKLTDQTDIFISNLSPHVISSTHKIQWTSPPTASDWAFLGNLIVSIKKERYLNHEEKNKSNN